MSLSTLITDDYDRRARLRPALLICFPAALAAVSSLPNLSGINVLVCLVAYFGFTALLSQLARDEGKRREPWLFERWGGKPTTQLLRHRDQHLDVNTKTRYHSALSALLPMQVMPSLTSEGNDHAAADSVYDACTVYLRNQTRDKTNYPLVYAENVNYGFRRNLWAMKKAGVAITLCALSLTVIQVVTGGTWDKPPAIPLIATIINACMLTWWLTRITPDWVRTPAIAYSERLLAACDTLCPAVVARSSLITSIH